MDSLQKFESSSLDDLLERVYRDYGPEARIVAANRIRRGGVGGFFAREGFEIVVASDEEGEASMSSSSPEPRYPVDPGRPGHDPAPVPTASLSTMSAMSTMAAVASMSSTANAPAAASGPDARMERLMGLVAETERLDHREPATFADALERAMSDNGAGSTAPALDTFSSDDRHLTLDLDELVFLDAETAGLDAEPAGADLLDEDDAAAMGELLPFHPFVPGLDLPFPVAPAPLAPAAVAAPVVPVVALPAAAPEALPAPAPESAPEGSPVPGDAPAASLAPPSTWDLIDRFAAIPNATSIRFDEGVVVIVGDLDAVRLAADRFAREHSGAERLQVVVATSGVLDDAPAWSVIASPDDAEKRAHRWEREKSRVIVAVDLGPTTSGLAWARRVIRALDPFHVRMAIGSGSSIVETNAMIELLDVVDAIDIVDVDPTIDVDELLSLAAPIATLSGHVATPALWAALTLERWNRG